MSKQVQDLNVIYDIKDRLDAEGIYDDGHVLNFITARYQTAAAFNTGGQTEHMSAEDIAYVDSYEGPVVLGQMDRRPDKTKDET